MTEGFRSSPPPTQETPVRTPDSSRYRQEVTETVQRIMGEDIAPPVEPDTEYPAAPTDNGDGSTTEVAKQQTAEVADTAKQAGAQVAGTVQEQAGQVTEEVKHQAKQLLSQAQSELSEQAASTQQRVSEGLHALADELTGMAKNSEQDGVATDLARQAADRARTAAGWLADRDPGSLLDEVRSFARNRPGTYLALALGAGVVAGRVTRGLTAPTNGTGGDTGGSATTSKALPTQFDGTEPVAAPFGAPSSAVTGALPAVSSPMAGLGTTGVLGDPRGDVTP